MNSVKVNTMPGRSVTVNKSYISDCMLFKYFCLYTRQIILNFRSYLNLFSAIFHVKKYTGRGDESLKRAICQMYTHQERSLLVSESL
jgi:hypothetical protein